MNDFEKWFKSLNKNGRVTYFLGQEGRISEEAWNHQQAIIDDLIHKAKLRESDHRALLVKYQATKKCWEDVSGKCEELKAQLDNMEACYIEKKKQVEDQQKRIDECKKLTTSIRNEFDLWSDDSEFADVIEAQIENLEALRGGS